MKKTWTCLLTLAFVGACGDLSPGGTGEPVAEQPDASVPGQPAPVPTVEPPDATASPAPPDAAPALDAADDAAPPVKPHPDAGPLPKPPEPPDADGGKEGPQ